jgi:hypothetical protein
MEDLSDEAITETFIEATSAYEDAPATAPSLTNSSEVLQVIKRPKPDKARSPNSIPNKVLGHYLNAR